MKHIHTEITFILIGEHPHAGENAHPVGETVNTITRETLYGKEMYLLELVDCPHGTDRCYAAKENMRLINQGKAKP
jgi:hypothetical protein